MATFPIGINYDGTPIQININEQTPVSLLLQLALSFDGAVIGFSIAYAAVRFLLKFTDQSAALRKLRNAPSVSVSDLRSLLADGNSDDGKVVFVHGTVVNALRHSNLVSSQSGDKGVVLQRTQTCICSEWRGLFGWSSDLRSIFAQIWRQQKPTSLTKVPFILVDVGQLSNTEYAVVNFDDSRHPLPLTTVYRQLQPISPPSFTLPQALFGHKYPVVLMDEEKILPLEKDIIVVGIFNLKNGIAEIKSCKDLPYFLSDLSKDQMIVDLSFKTKILFWSGIVLGSMSIGILSYSVMRNWNRWKRWKQWRQLQQQRQMIRDDVDPHPDDEIEDIHDGQLCVVCLMRRRRSFFIPCGHLVCCQGCAISVQCEVTPKCPVCRQEIQDSVRVVES